MDSGNHDKPCSLLFVYGTLMDARANPVAARLWRDGMAAGDAWYQGRLYRVAHYPGVVPSDDPGDRVHGRLIRLRATGRLFPELDAYEGVPDLYTRQQVRVTTTDGKIVAAWIYLYNRPVKHLPRIRSGDFRRQFSPL